MDSRSPHTERTFKGVIAIIIVLIAMALAPEIRLMSEGESVLFERLDDDKQDQNNVHP